MNVFDLDLTLTLKQIL